MQMKRLIAINIVFVLLLIILPVEENKVETIVKEEIKIER